MLKKRRVSQEIKDPKEIRNIFNSKKCYLSGTKKADCYVGYSSSIPGKDITTENLGKKETLYYKNKCEERGGALEGVTDDGECACIPDYKCNNLNIDYDDINKDSIINYRPGIEIEPQIDPEDPDLEGNKCSVECETQFLNIANPSNYFTVLDSLNQGDQESLNKCTAGCAPTEKMDELRPKGGMFGR